MKLARNQVLPFAVFAILFATIVVLQVSPAWSELTSEEVRRFRYDFGVSIYENYADSVVYVTGDFIDPHKRGLEEYFDDSVTKLPNSIGTGFFILPSGYVLTNAHGVHKSVVPVVETRSGKRYDAEVVGFIMNEDIALLKIKPEEKIKSVRFCPSGEIKPGEPIITIGHPHGLRYTCTQGIVSATGRRSTLTDMKVTLDNLLQSDAGINPGSSGGPWFNLDYEVVGMTASRRSGSDNIAFGVAATTFYRVLPRLLDFPRRNGFSLGAEVVGCNVLKIKSIDPTGAIARAGLKENDVLVKVDQTDMVSLLDYLACEENFAAQKPVQWTITRDGRPLTVTVTPDLRPQLDANALLWQKAGMKVRPITEAEAKLCDLRSKYGMIITQIDAAQYEKLDHPPKVGDILAKFDYVRPDTMEHLARLADAIKTGERTSMVILRVTDKQTQETLLTLEPDGRSGTVSSSGETPSENTVSAVAEKSGDKAANGQTTNPEQPANSDQPSGSGNESTAEPDKPAPDKPEPDKTAPESADAPSVNNTDASNKPIANNTPREKIRTRIDISDFVIR